MSSQKAHREFLERAAAALEHEREAASKAQKTCRHCGSEFSLFRRRKVCGRCDRVVCNNCSVPLRDFAGQAVKSAPYKHGNLLCVRCDQQGFNNGRFDPVDLLEERLAPTAQPPARAQGRTSGIASPQRASPIRHRAGAAPARSDDDDGEGHNSTRTSSGPAESLSSSLGGRTPGGRSRLTRSSRASQRTMSGALTPSSEARAGRMVSGMLPPERSNAGTGASTASLHVGSMVPRRGLGGAPIGAGGTVTVGSYIAASMARGTAPWLAADSAANPNAAAKSSAMSAVAAASYVGSLRAGGTLLRAPPAGRDAGEAKGRNVGLSSPVVPMEHMSPEDVVAALDANGYVGSLPAEFFKALSHLQAKPGAAAEAYDACSVSIAQEALLRHLCATPPPTPLVPFTWVGESVNGPRLARGHLRACLELLLRRHALLRCGVRDASLVCFTATTADFQCMAPQQPASWGRAEAQHALTAALQAPFEPQKATTLLRVRVAPYVTSQGPASPASPASTSKESFLLGLSLHPLVGDEGTLAIIVQDLRALYRSADQLVVTAADGRCSINEPLLARLLPPTRASYHRAYVVAEDAFLQRDAQRFGSEKAQQFWREHEEHAPATLELPHTAAWSPTVGGNPPWGIQRATMPPEQSAEVLRCARQYYQAPSSGTASTMVLGAYAVALMRYAGQDAVAIATRIDRRKAAPSTIASLLQGEFAHALLAVPEVAAVAADIAACFDDAVGPFEGAHTLVFTQSDGTSRVGSGAEAPVAAPSAFMNALQNVVKEAAPHALFPAAALHSSPGPTSAKAGFVDVGGMTANDHALPFLLNTGGGTCALGDVLLASVPAATAAARPPGREGLQIQLRFWVDPSADILEFALEYDTSIWSEQTAREFLSSLTTLLSALAESIVHLGAGPRPTPCSNESFSARADSAAPALLAAPTETIFSLPMVDAHQTARLTEAMNTRIAPEGVDIALPAAYEEMQRGRGVHGLVDAAFDRHADRIALKMPEEGPQAALTYAELERLSRGVAVLLRERYGVRSNTVVAIAMTRCVAQMVCVLGVLRAGGAYLPLDVSYPVDRLEFMLHDSNVACVLSRRDVVDGPLRALLGALPPAPSGEPRVLCIGDDLHKGLAGAVDRYLEPTIVEPESATYVIYTSGSTGKPKGVVMNHRAHTNLVLWQNSYLATRTHLPADTDPYIQVLQFSPISFDVSFQELFTTWSAGGCVVMVSEDLRLDPVGLVRFMNSHTIHRLFVPFVALAHVAESALDAGVFPTTLVDIITAGEQLIISKPVIDLFERLITKHQQDAAKSGAAPVAVQLHNHYGPSETHVCSYYVLRGDPRRWLHLPPIGYPIANTQLYVLDDALHVVPPGTVGELYIAGACVGTGYLNRDDLTQAAFVPCPFSYPQVYDGRTPVTQKRLMYKTGDLVQMMPDGALLYVRRKDTQVKVRGFRIELGEIEARLSQLDAVRKCCVVVREDVPGDKRVVAYVAIASTAAQAGTPPQRTALVADLKAALRQHMPDYMVPTVFVFLESLPLTPSGKINRKGMPAPTEAQVAESSGLADRDATAANGADGDTTVPMDDEERGIQALAGEVLRLPAAGLTVTASFFSLGGHSLSMTKLVSRINAKFGVELSVAAAFRGPTVRELAAQVRELLKDRPAADAATSGRPRTLSSAAGGSFVRVPVPGSVVRTATMPLGSLVAASLRRGGGLRGLGGSDDRFRELVRSEANSLTFNQKSMLFLQASKPEAAAMYNIAIQGLLRIACGRRSDRGVTMPCSSGSDTDSEPMGSSRPFYKHNETGSVDELGEPVSGPHNGQHRFSSEEPEDGGEPVLSLEQLRSAFERVLERHASLRTTYHQDTDTGVFVQTVHEQQDLDFSIEEADFSVEAFDRRHFAGAADAHPSTGPEALQFHEYGAAPDDALDGMEHVRALLYNESVKPFDLSSDPLMRVRVFVPREIRAFGPVPTTRAVVQIVFHHIATDLWSLDVIVADLMRELQQSVASAGGPARKGGASRSANPSLCAAPAPAPYIDYAKYLQQRHDDGHFARSVMYWKRKLRVGARELPVLEMPTDFPRPQTVTTAGDVYTFNIPPTLSCALDRFGKRHDSTMYVTLLSLLFITLHKYTRQDEIIIGTPFGCRNLERFEDTVGYFINSCPIIQAFPEAGDGAGAAAQTFVDIVKDCRASLTEALDHQEYPFPLLADKVVGTRAASHTPVFQTLFTFQRPQTHAELTPFVMYRDGGRLPLAEGVQWDSIAIPSHHAMFDLVFQFAELPSPSGDGAPDIIGAVEFNTDLYSRKTIMYFVQTLLHVAEQVVAAADISIAEISTMPSCQQQTILTRFNQHPGNVLCPASFTLPFGPTVAINMNDDADATFVSLFDKIVLHHEDSIAVSFGTSVTPPPPEAPSVRRQVSGLIVEKLTSSGHQRTTTYRELYLHSLYVGAKLVEHCGVERDEIIGVSLRRSAFMVAAFIGVMRAGCAYVPLDPGYPPERLQYMADDAQCRTILCAEADRHLFRDCAGVKTILVLEDLVDGSAAFAHMHRKDLRGAAATLRVRMPALSSRQLAYVIYTSGSTGRPKGTLLEHRGLVNLCFSIRLGYRMKYAHTRFLLFASASFDASALEIFVPLANACTIVMLSELPIVAEQLADAMAEAKVTLAVLPPSVLATMPEEKFPSSHLEALVTAGEAINDELVSRWRQRVHLINAYGPTENTVCSTICDYADENLLLVSTHKRRRELAGKIREAATLEDADDDATIHSDLRTQTIGGTPSADGPASRQRPPVVAKAPPIGRPIANTCAFIVDGRLRPVGIGIPGELVVTGPGVARGYHNQPDRTASAFIPNLIDPTQRALHQKGTAERVRHRDASAYVSALNVVAPGAYFPTLYRTGDLVRWLASGNIEFLGRIDAQVKLRGYRIELGEVEAVIMRFGPCIHECAVDVRTLDTGKALVAYIVPSPAEAAGPAPTIAQLKAFVRSELPEYMIPSAFVTLQRLPLNPSGKVDRKSLPAPVQADLHGPASSDPAADEQALDKVSPVTPTQAAVAMMVGEVLGLSGIGLSDDFFALGGHSLAAMQLVSRLREQFGVDIPIARIFEASRIDAIAETVGAAITGEGQQDTGVQRHFEDDNVSGLVYSTAGGGGSSGTATDALAAQSVMTTQSNPADDGLDDCANATKATRTFPLSLNQESLWFAYTLNPKSAALNVSFVAKIAAASQGAFDKEAFAKALHAIAALNPALRTSYRGDSGSLPTQRVRFTVRLVMQETVWDAQAEQSPEAQAARIEQDTHTPLHLEGGISWRVFMYARREALTAAQLQQRQAKSRSASPARCENVATHFMLLFHHIISDLGSMEVIVHQLGVFYNDAVSPGGLLHGLAITDLDLVSSKLKQQLAAVAYGDRAEASAALQVNYVDYVFWQREWLMAQKGERLLGYWQRHLAGCPQSTSIPSDFARPQLPTNRGGAVLMPLPDGTFEAVQALARSLSATPVSVLLASIVTWVHRITSQTDVVIGMPSSGRTRVELENVVGDFVNIVPVRVTMDEAPRGADPAGSGAADPQALSGARIVKDTFRSCVKKAKTAIVGALMHQEYPFQLMVQHLLRHRDASRSPFFQIMLVHEKPHHSVAAMAPFVLGDSGGRLTLGAVTLESVPTAEHTCMYDLVFAVSEGDNGAVHCRLQYASDLFRPETVRRFGEQWVAVLQEAMQDAGACVSRFCLQSADERQQLRAINAATADPYPAVVLESTTLAHLFVEAVAAHGSSVAVIDPMDAQKTMTYTELMHCASALASDMRTALQEHAGEYREHADGTSSWGVCLLLPRSVEYVTAVVASCLAGATYTPIDIKVPEQRAAYIVRDSGCAVLVAAASQQAMAEDILAALDADGCPLPELVLLSETFITDLKWQSQPVRIAPLEGRGGDSPLYTIYTSGSTGTPKGVVIHNRGVVNVCAWFIKAHKVVPGDVSAQNLGAAFDPVTIELWPYFLAGASVVVMDEDSKMGGPEATIAFLHRHKVTHITFPTVLSQLIFEQGVFPDGFALRSWSCGGDKFKGTTRPLPFALINAYGPTECCVLCSQYPINFDVPSREEHDSIPRPPQAGRIAVDPPLGRPTGNTALYVLDENMTPVPRGVVGELCVGGAQVGIAYRNNESGTRKSFVPDPFRLHADYARKGPIGTDAAAESPLTNASSTTTTPFLYKTGDLVKLDEHFNIHFVGRKDAQVKIRGYRIELGEIESLVGAIATVQGVCVVPYEPPGTESKRLYAFVTLKDDTKARADVLQCEVAADIAGFVKTKLPHYMVPEVIIIAQFPLTPNGKVDRAALPALIPESVLKGGGTVAAAAAAGGSAHVPPTTLQERRLCDIWEEILHTKPIGLQDNWYDRGGSSLTSTLLLSRMRQVFQMEISIQQFFADPTVRGMLRLVAEKGQAAVANNILDVLDEDAANLDPSIGAHTNLLGYVEAAEGPMNIFLTGATGFLGAFLLFELLQRTRANIYCLTRAASEADASRRIVENLSGYEIFEGTPAEVAGAYLNRVVPVVGDLGLPNFGLSKQRFEELSQLIDVVFHNGALVNFSYPYVSLKAANVGGTVTGLRLATSHHLKPFHFVSTLSTVPTPDAAVGGKKTASKLITERPLGKADHDLHGGYTQTKWVAEKLVALAGSRGVPVTIHRPGRITGHTRTGATNVDDFLNLMIKGCLQLKSVPLLDMPCDMTPVDYAAAAIVQASLSRYAPTRPAGGLSDATIFHITNPSSMPWEAVVRAVLRHGGYDVVSRAADGVEWLPFGEWRAKRLLKLKGDSHCALLPLVPMITAEFEHEAAPNDVGTSNVDHALRGTGVVCPPTDEALIAQYARYFVKVGFLPSPNEVAANTTAAMINA